MTPINTQQVKAPRHATTALAAVALANYAATTWDVFGAEIEPLREGPERQVVGWTVKITDGEGYSVGYI